MLAFFLVSIAMILALSSTFSLRSMWIAFNFNENLIWTLRVNENLKAIGIDQYTNLRSLHKVICSIEFKWLKQVKGNRRRCLIVQIGYVCLLWLYWKFLTFHTSILSLTYISWASLTTLLPIITYHKLPNGN